jgi:hypothetical protein
LKTLWPIIMLNADLFGGPPPPIPYSKNYKDFVNVFL